MSNIVGPSYILTLSCKDVAGIVAAVSGFLYEHSGFINESAQFGDSSTGCFFMRTDFSSTDPSVDRQFIAQRFSEIAKRFSMQWQLSERGSRLRTLVMVSKQGHCLNGLLHRAFTGSLAIDIAAVASNHEDLRSMTEWYGIPYYYLPITQKTKPQQESQILDLCTEHDIELVALARYMQVLSPSLVSALYGKAINIHHSFLPGFKGARPYHQAFDRGVKIIGATAHYVSDSLDEGPIIEQEVTRVDHTYTPDMLKTTGEDIETSVLARAIHYHAEHRVLINGNKTVVFK